MQDSRDSGMPPAAVQSGEAAAPLVESTQPETQDEGSKRAAISNALVGLKKEFYGKGPVKAKTYLNDDYVFCVLEGGLTRNEQTLVDAGEERLVRQYRLRFQEVVQATAMQAVEQVMGRKVLTYHSQIVFHPERAFEVFVLEPRPDED